MTLSVTSAFIIQPPIKKPLIKKLKRTDNIYIENNNNKKLPKYLSKNKELILFNIPITPEICAISFLYFIQSFFSISKLAISFYYKDILNLNSFDFTIVISIISIPWIIKPLYGFISDTFPFFGYKRNSYLILSSIIGSLSWIIMAITFNSFTNNIPFSILLIILSYLGLTFSDVLLDAIVVSKSRELNIKNSLQLICLISLSLGSITSSYLSGYLLQKYGINFIFYLTSIIPLITIVISNFIKEKKIKSFNYNSRYSIIYTIILLKIQIKKIFNTLSQKELLYPLIFLIIYNIIPKIGITLFYFEVNKLGFKPEYFGNISLAISISSLLGILIYNQILKLKNYLNILKWLCIINIFLGLSPLILVTQINKLIGIPDIWIAVIDDIAITIFYQITIIPILMLALQICPPGIEAMLFAIIMSINNLSNSIGKINGAVLTNILSITNNNFTNLYLLIILSNLLGLIPLLFLHFIPNKK